MGQSQQLMSNRLKAFGFAVLMITATTIRTSGQSESSLIDAVRRQEIGLVQGRPTALYDMTHHPKSPTRELLMHSVIDDAVLVVTVQMLSDQEEVWLPVAYKMLASVQAGD